MKSTIVKALAGLMAMACVSGAQAAAQVEMTWMSIANWYFRIGDKRIMMDAYITRVPGPPFFFAPPDLPGDQYAFTQKVYGIDEASIRKVRDAVLGNDKLDLLLAGHAHFDHSW